MARRSPVAPEWFLPQDPLHRLPRKAVLIIIAACCLLLWAFLRSRSTDASQGPSVGSEGRVDDLAASVQSSAPTEADNWEGTFWEVAEPRQVHARLRLQYRDGAGRKSDRIVDVRQFGSFGPTTLIIGHCNTRQATRTFRVDRIHECVDLFTGEVIGDVSAFLRSKYNASPERSRDSLLETHFDTLRVLLYVGKADGQLRAPERAKIHELCVRVSGDTRITLSMIESLLAELETPTLTAFKQAVGRVSNANPAHARDILQASEEIVATQKSVSPGEAEALTYLRKRLSAT